MIRLRLKRFDMDVFRQRLLIYMGSNNGRVARTRALWSLPLVILIIILVILNWEPYDPDLQDYATHQRILATRIFPKHPRPHVCKNCNSFNFTSIIEPRNVCAGEVPIELLILITVTPKAVKAREAIRSTWASYSENNTANVRHLFLFGGGWNDAEQRLLKRESALYGDILQNDYKDAYYNLSYKVIMGYKWALKHCPRANFVLRTADDNYVNVPRTVEWVRAEGQDTPRAQVGHVFWKMKVHRYTDKKWYVSNVEYPKKYFPPYAVGTAFLYSIDSVREVVEAAPNIPFFAIEDAWFGMVMKSINMRPVEVAGFDSLLTGRNLRWLHGGYCPYYGQFYALHLASPDAMHKLWDICEENKSLR